MSTSYRVANRTTVYREHGGADVRVEKLEVLSSAGTFTTHAVSTKDASCGAVCIAIKEEKILLARHWRATTESHEWEFPRGMGEQGETVEQTAQRELLEETGITASTTTLLGHIHADTGILRDDIAVAVLAITDEKTTRTTDGELEDIRWVEPATLDTMIAHNEIRDGITLAAYLLWGTLHRLSKAPSPR